jgi:hypothetical protein
MNDTGDVAHRRSSDQARRVCDQDPMVRLLIFSSQGVHRGDLNVGRWLTRIAVFGFSYLPPLNTRKTIQVARGFGFGFGFEVGVR